MKKIYVLALVTLFGLNAMAQQKSNVVVFAEDGETFFAFLNGVKQNATAQANVKITEIPGEGASLRVVFANSSDQPLKQDMYFMEPNQEHTIKIKRDKKGVLKMKYFGAVAIAQSTSSAPVIAYTPTELPAASNNTGTTNTTETVNTTNTGGTVNTTNTSGTTGTETFNMNTQVNDPNMNGTTTSQTVTTTTTTNGGTNTGTGNISMNVGVGENGFNMNVSVSGTGTGDPSAGSGSVNMHTGMNTTETVSTTTTSSSSNGYNSSSSSTTTTNGNTGYTDNTNYNTGTATSTTTSNNGCSFAMDETSFGKMKKAVESASFSDTKMSTAKTGTRNNCLSTDQVKALLALFNMDEEKLDYAKYAYDYTVDKNNFYLLGEAFHHDGSKDELNQFIDTKR